MARSLPSVFQAVKENVTARQAALLYGIDVKHNGMACCPFHDDKTPSMKLDERYYCFGCHATGDAIDLVSNLFQIGNLEAAKQIAEDFHLNYDRNAGSGKGRPLTAEQKREMEMRQLQKEIQEWRKKLSSDLSGDYRLLTEKADRYRPVDLEAPFPARFVEAVKDLELVEFYINLLDRSSKEQLVEIFFDKRPGIERLHNKIIQEAKVRESVSSKLKQKMELLRKHPNNNQPTAGIHHRAAI